MATSGKLAYMARAFSLLSLACAGTLSSPRETPTSLAQFDAALFEAVLGKITSEPYRRAVRVDPRPLHNDPNLVTTKWQIARIVPEYVSAEPNRVLFADTAPSILLQRKDVLRRLALQETNGELDALCEGALVPPDPAMPNRKKQQCPPESYYSVMVALPRQGGVFWPANFDERAKYRKKRVYSVRTIEQSVGPNGLVQVSADYVFERRRSGEWIFLESRPLLIVE